MWQQRGFSLLEAMLACSLGSFLLLGLLQIYWTVHTNLPLQQAIASMQENGRFASHLLRQAIAMAGDARCVSPPPFVNHHLAIRGYENTVPEFLRGKVMPSTDSLVVGRCQTVEGKAQFAQYGYFIGKTIRKNLQDEFVAALYESPVVGYKQELIPNVKAMKIHYGIASHDGKFIEAYQPASAITDWSRVKIVAIALLLSSEKPVLSKPIPYEFAGQTFPPSRFLHREWDIDIALQEG